MQENNSCLRKIIIFFALGLVIGGTLSLSLLRTNWTTYQIDIFFWWSIVSTILGFILTSVSVAQYFVGNKEKEIHKSQVKIWQHYAYGIQGGLLNATYGKFSSVEDLKGVINAFHHCTRSLYTSLNEERLFTDQEIKEKQIANEKEMSERLKNISSKVVTKNEN